MHISLPNVGKSQGLFVAMALEGSKLFKPPLTLWKNQEILIKQAKSKNHPQGIFVFTFTKCKNELHINFIPREFPIVQYLFPLWLGTNVEISKHFHRVKCSGKKYFVRHFDLFQTWTCTCLRCWEAAMKVPCGPRLLYRPASAHPRLPTPKIHHHHSTTQKCHKAEGSSSLCVV